MLYVASASHTVNVLHVTCHYHTVANQPPAANHSNNETRGRAYKGTLVFLFPYLRHHTYHIPHRHAVANQSPPAANHNNNKTRPFHVDVPLPTTTRMRREGGRTKVHSCFLFFLSASPHLPHSTSTRRCQPITASSQTQQRRDERLGVCTNVCSCFISFICVTTPTCRHTSTNDWQRASV